MLTQYYFNSPTYLDVHELHTELNYFLFHKVSMNKKSVGFVRPILLKDTN